MSISELDSQFKTAFQNAKFFVKQNEALAAREYLITCMSIMLEMYKVTSGIMERAKLYAHISYFKNISAILYENGINADVKTFFGINEQMENGEKKKATSSRIDKIISDDSIDWAADVFERNIRSVVTISAKSNGIVSSGTGFIVSQNGYLLTNDHVVFDENSCDYFKKIMMQMYESKLEIALEVISSDRKSDVALCKFDISQAGDIFPVKCIKDYTKLLPGAAVVAIGNGLSKGLAPLTGTVKFTHDECDNLVTTIPSNHGDSGGPIFNSKGECVGINKSITVSVRNGANVVETRGIANATSMDQINALLAKWCEQHAIEL